MNVTCISVLSAIKALKQSNKKNFFQKRGKTKMKRSMKKFMVTCAAVSAIAAVASVSAMAADYTADNNSVAYTVPTPDAETQMTVLVVPEGAEVTDENIYYIDQDGTLSGNALLKGTELADGTYVVKVGYYKDGEFTIAEDKFTVGETSENPDQPTYTLGDVNGDEEIDSQDSLMVLEYEVGNTDLTDTQKLAADTNKDEEVDSQDSLLILEYEVGNISGF